MRKFTIFFVLIILVSFGCKQRAITQPEAQPPQPQKEQKAEEAKPQKPAEEAGAQKGAVVEKSEIKSEEEAEAEAAGKEGLFKDIHFDFDKYSIQGFIHGRVEIDRRVDEETLRRETFHRRPLRRPRHKRV